ncbi:hypothetical protein EK403_15290 [Hansschlegelia zhihuaiae]|uniref:Uncharacterized protein n=2 Tax=Methylopilaceae TaxID=3149309 RepID=A0A4Q0MF71_9HYPH|nr:hypothetical protein [Bosea sp. (in: a-proteobacteria)]RXF71536.1 hypothetical protein EK403_15290 [Hansschlegelia zhihuaiae]
MVPRKDALSGILLVALGVVSLGIATFFLVLRPSLLPEDLAYTGVDASALPEAFHDWLRIVFRTWGGFIAGLGCLLVGVGVFLLTGRLRWLYLGSSAGIVLAFGRFLFSNIVLGSNFLWLIAAAFALALCTAFLLVVRSGR